MDTSNINQRLERIEKLLLDQRKVLNFNDLAVYTGLSHSYLYKLTSKGSIPMYRPNGKQLFFKKEEIDEWLLRNPIKTNIEIYQEAITHNYIKTRNK